ncbi:ABC transporter permease [Streptomyces sp. NPDC002838]|uniref:ABC transporter permease n=1 Tax=Streptomyces sp. NPDC002838 TaxID=3154436 RepID=UPI003316A64C
MELPATRAGRVARSVSATLILLFLALPIIVIVVTSFGADGLGDFPPKQLSTRWYEEIGAPGSDWATAIGLSCLVAALTTAFSLVLGVTTALALARGRLPLRSAVYGLVLAPLLIPHVVIALGLFLLFEPLGMLGSPLAIALGHTVLAAPVAVLILVATLRGIDERLEDAAASMGATRLTIARQITLPLAMPGLFAATVFSFITSFDEFFIAQFLSTADTRTLPIEVFNALQFDVDPTVTAISSVLIGLSVLALALVATARRLGGTRDSQGALPVETVTP